MCWNCRLVLLQYIHLYDFDTAQLYKVEHISLGLVGMDGVCCWGMLYVPLKYAEWYRLERSLLDKL